MDEPNVVTVTREGSDEAERIMLHSRDGHKVYVRAVDPCDPEPKPVETYKGDELIMMEHISHISHHLMQEATRGTCSRNGSAAITSL